MPQAGRAVLLNEYSGRSRLLRRCPRIRLPRPRHPLHTLAHRRGFEDVRQAEAVCPGAGRRGERARHDGDAVAQGHLREGGGVAARQLDPQGEAAGGSVPAPVRQVSCQKPVRRSRRSFISRRRIARTRSASASRRTATSCPMSEPPRSAMIFNRVIRSQDLFGGPDPADAQASPEELREGTDRQHRRLRSRTPRSAPAGGPTARDRRACCPRRSAAAGRATAARARGGTTRA